MSALPNQNQGEVLTPAPSLTGARILLFVFNKPHFRDMMRLARSLRDRRGCRVVLWFGSHHPSVVYPGHESDIAEAVAEGFRDIVRDGDVISSEGDALAFAAAAEPYRNLIRNGAFDLWSNGEEFHSDTYGGPSDFDSADGWRLRSPGGDTRVIVSRESLRGGKSPSGEPCCFLRWRQLQPSTALPRLNYRIAGACTLAGRAAVLSFWARSDRTLTIPIWLEVDYGDDDVITVPGGTVSIGPVWARCEINLAVPYPDDFAGMGHYDICWSFPLETVFVFDMTMVQFEAGHKASVFEYRPAEAEAAHMRAILQRGQEGEDPYVRLWQQAQSVQPPPRESIPRVRRQGLATRLRSTVSRHFASTRAGRIWAEYRLLGRKRRNFLAMLDRYKPRLMVFGEDNVAFPSSLYILAGKSRQIPSVILPFCLTDSQELLLILRDAPAFVLGAHTAWLFKLLMPHWVRFFRGRTVIRMPPPTAVAMVLQGLSPPEPWIYHNGYSDVIGVESLYMLAQYQRDGLVGHPMAMVGALYDDFLHEGLTHAEERREALYAELGLPPGRPMILLALPGDVTGQRLPHMDFGSYLEMVTFWAETARAVPGWNVVMAPHPTVPPTNLPPCNGENIAICSADTPLLVPLCDIFVASVSSTIRWATACGKPVLNYDCYRMRYDYFGSALGVISITEKTEFQAEIARMTQDRCYYEDLRRRQEACGWVWGILDGRAADRLDALFDAMIAGKAPPPVTFDDPLIAEGLARVRSGADEGATL